MVGEPWQNAVQRAGSQLRYESQTGGTSQNAGSELPPRPLSGSSGRPGGPSGLRSPSAASASRGGPGPGSVSLPRSPRLGGVAAPAAAAPVSKSKSRRKERLPAAKGNDVRCSRSAKGRCRINKAWVNRCKKNRDHPECGDQYASHEATRDRIKTAREAKMLRNGTLDAYQANQRDFVNGTGKFRGRRHAKDSPEAKLAMEAMRKNRVTYNSGHYLDLESPETRNKKRLAKKYLAELKHLGVDTRDFHRPPGGGGGGVAARGGGQYGGAQSGGERAKGHAACGYQNGRCRRTKASVRNTDLTNARRHMSHDQRVEHGTNISSAWTEFVTKYRGFREESGIFGRRGYKAAQDEGDNHHLWLAEKKRNPRANFITFCSQEWHGLGEDEKDRLTKAKRGTMKAHVRDLNQRKKDDQMNYGNYGPPPLAKTDFLSGGSQDGGWDGFSDTSSTRSSDFTSVSDTTSFSASTDSSSMW